MSIRDGIWRADIRLRHGSGLEAQIARAVRLIFDACD